MKNDQKKTNPSTTNRNNTVLNPEIVKKSSINLANVHHLPRRYMIKDTNGNRILTCLEAPNISVRVEAELTVSASAAQKSPPGAIYLDGLAQCEPFMNLAKQIYNFDHHEGCLRPFTISTCEQVLLMILI